MDTEHNLMESKDSEAPVQGVEEIDKTKTQDMHVIKKEAPRTFDGIKSENFSDTQVIKQELIDTDTDESSSDDMENIDSVAPKNSECLESKRLSDSTDKKDITEERAQDVDMYKNGLFSVKKQEDIVDGRVFIEKDGFTVYIKQEPVDEEDERDGLAEVAQEPVEKEGIEKNDLTKAETAIKEETIDIVVEVELMLNEDDKREESETGNIESSKPKGPASTRKCAPPAIRRYECEICQRRFLGKGHLNTHIRTHTGEKPFECEVCKRRFIGKGDLNKHLRTHTGEKPFECSVCLQSFSQKSILNRHFRIHTGEKAFECQVCLQKFTVKSHLNRHLITHTGEKAFECQICQQRFSLKSTLDGHMRIHTGEKPFECEICRQRFSQSSTLNRHFRIHTGERPFECQICQQRFSLKSTLNGHLRTHTADHPLSVLTNSFMPPAVPFE